MPIKQLGSQGSHAEILYKKNRHKEKLRALGEYTCYTLIYIPGHQYNLIPPTISKKSS